VEGTIFVAVGVLSLFVASAVFGDVAAVMFECNFSWQAQYSVKLECRFSWRVQYLGKLWEIARARNVVCCTQNASPKWDK